MPAVPAATGEIYQVKLISKIENQDHLNIMAFAAASPSDDVQLRLLKAIVDCFLLHMMPGLHGRFTCLGAEGRRVSPTLGNPVLYLHNNAAVANTGLAAGDGLPSFNACSISIHTTTVGKSGRGRMAIGGIPEGSTTDSQLNTEGAFWIAVLAFIACVAEEFFVGDPIPANAWQIGVLSRKGHVKGQPYDAAKFSPATNLVPNRVISHIANRKVGRGS